MGGFNFRWVDSCIVTGIPSDRNLAAVDGINDVVAAENGTGASGSGSSEDDAVYADNVYVDVLSIACGFGYLLDFQQSICNGSAIHN